MRICKIGGCLSKVFARDLCVTHLRRAYRSGELKTKPKPGYIKHKTEYVVWCGIKSRCYTPSSSNYTSYGAKGIRMSDEWKNDFMSFYNDMGPRPGKGYEIDRIDPKGNYCKENCRWITKSENVKNRWKETDPADEYQAREQEVEDLPF